MKLYEPIKLLPVTWRQPLFPAAVEPRFGKSSGMARPGRYTLRFFAAMLVLTLVARGTSGAAMPQVRLTSPSQGTIVQQASASAVITAGEGETLALPAGVTVDALYATVGQSLKAGDPILQLSETELQDALAAANANRAQQQAQLDQLSVCAEPDESAVTAARQGLERAKEDYARTDERTLAAVDQANQALAAAQQTQDDTEQQWEELQQQADPPPTEEELTLARQAMDAAQSDLAAAQLALQDAEAAREDALLSAKRSVEDADSALFQANTAYAQAQASAALTAQDNAAQAQALRLELEQTDKTIAMIEDQIKANGLVCADRDTQLLACDLTAGQPCPEGNSLRLAKENSELLAQFSLSAKQAETVAAGQAVTITQGTARTEATVRTLENADESGLCRITAVISENTSDFKAGSAQAELVFSRTLYALCLPVSAIRQDAQGSYVLTVTEQQSAFGIRYTAQRVPVTVLEVDSDGQYAAVNGTLSGGVITSSNRAVSPGASVRLLQ